MMFKTKIVDLLKKAVKENIDFDILIPDSDNFGHYSTNIALKLVKIRKNNPLAIAQEIVSFLEKSVQANFFEKIEIAGPGFINFWISKKALQSELKEILKKKEKYGDLKIGQNKKIQVEFISANPTGPLTIGNGRGGPFGDTLANVLKKAGYKTTKEYYVNDAGGQIKSLGRSVLGEKGAEYSGDYIDKLKKKIKNKNVESVGQKAAREILKQIKKTVENGMRIKMDSWFLEKKELLDSNEIAKTIDWLKKKNLTYEKEDALWFKSSQFGDEKDRVLVKSNGETTYLASDIAYHKNKFVKRKFNQVINVWGADHHGDVGRVKAAVEVLGFKNKLEIILMQFVRLVKDGKEVRMSKRKGVYVTVDDLLKEVGRDAFRFFFLMYSPDSHINFDLKLAKEHSLKNPVYYVQYAAVRAKGILKKYQALSIKYQKTNKKIDFNLLDTNEDIKLMLALSRFPEKIEKSANKYSPQVLVRYALDLAREFHNFYEKERIGGENEKLMLARLELIKAISIVFGILFDILGITYPEKM